MQINSNLERVGVAALAGTGLLHVALSPEYFGEAAYVGALFVVGGVAALAAAVAIWRTNDERVWAAAALLAAGMGLGFVLSRTTGLPGFHESEWEASGLLSLVLEGIVVIAALNTIRGPRSALAQAR